MSSYQTSLKPFSILAITILLVMGIGFVVTVENELDGTTHGSASNPLSSITDDINSANGNTYYVSVGSSVTITGTGDEGGNDEFWYNVTGVTNGYGLTCDDSYNDSSMGCGTGRVNGTITKAGTITVSGSYMNGLNSGGLSCTIIAVSDSTPVTSISISGSSSGKVGGTITLTATTGPSTADDRHVTWSISSGSSRASIYSTTDTSTGGRCVISLESAGSVTVKATANDGSGVSKTKTITISNPEYTCYLKYNANGGSGAPTTQPYTGTSTSNHTFTISSVEPTRSGYTFLGWSKSSTATTASYTSGDTIPVGYDDVVNLYAVWKENPKTYTLSFNANGGSGAPSSLSGTSDTGSYKFTIPAAFMTKEGYSFLGWSTSSTATTASYTAGQTYTTSSTSATLYAVWQQQNSFTLSFNVGVGSGSVSSQTYKSSETTHTFAITSSKPTAPEGYEFVGWSKTSGSTTAEYTASSRITVSPGTTTLYAVYQEIVYTYTILYNSDGGQNTPTATTGTSTGSFMMLTVTSDEPTYTGMVFKGWSSTRGATTAEYTAGESVRVTGTMTLYAVWVPAQIEISGTPVTKIMTGSSWTYTPTVSVEGCTITVSGADWLQVSNGMVFGTPTSSDAGTFNITITASHDGYTDGVQTFTVETYSPLTFEGSPVNGVIAWAL